MKTILKYLFVVYVLSSCRVENHPGFAEITYNLKLVENPDFQQIDTLTGVGNESVNTIDILGESDSALLSIHIHKYKGVGIYDLDEVGFFISYTSSKPISGTSEIFNHSGYTLDVKDTLDWKFEITSAKNGVLKGKFNLYAQAYRCKNCLLTFNFSNGEFVCSLPEEENKFFLSKAD